ncbi:zinc finger protein 3 [Elephas maximus indicus]|uniref:zinc finger protein 3 n=1 Tax=Elephas maximus indicus TaxID=99487 RepID=UPI0021165864|nr:zinc finger protein 3 [Elephas maximus indicus]
MVGHKKDEGKDMKQEMCVLGSGRKVLGTEVSEQPTDKRARKDKPGIRQATAGEKQRLPGERGLSYREPGGDVCSCTPRRNLYTCPEHGKAFGHSSTLIIHQRIHTGQKRFGCGDCGKAFTRSSRLIPHQRVYMREKSYVCGTCGKAFSQDASLLAYLQRQLLPPGAPPEPHGEEPYECLQCSKAFTCSSYLLMHQRTRTGEKPYHCTQCEKAFGQSSHLIFHQTTHAGKKYQLPSLARTQC